MKKTTCIHSNDVTYILPGEDTGAILHNPDMGWALYDNHAMISRPLPSGEPPITGRYENHLVLSDNDYDYPGVDNIVLILAWSDIEIEKDIYDFTYFDEIYDFWRARGKQILLGMSSETKVWYKKHGQGAPDYMLDYLGSEKVQIRHVKEREGTYFYLCDVGDPYYIERLRAFLTAFSSHLKETNRPIHYADLRGYGMWGEWHSGYIYPDVETKREALAKVVAAWAECLPDMHLAISYSYDPDEPFDNYTEPNLYQEYLRWSAYDLAIQYPNVTIRRDGAGKEVKNAERMLCEDLFKTLDRGPFTAEGCNGYDPRRVVEYILTDGLSLHPNYFTVVGWGGSEARRFLEDYPDLIEQGLLNMGYRFVVTYAAYASRCQAGATLKIDTTWINRAVGRAPHNFEVRFLLVGAEDSAIISAGMNNCSKWIKDHEYAESYSIPISEKLSSGQYTLGIGLYDPISDTYIALPMADKMTDPHFYSLGSIEVLK